MIWERLLVVLMLALVGTGAFTAFKQAHTRRVNRRILAEPIIARPTLLYFRSDTCAVCPTQARYLEQVMAEEAVGNGRFTLHSINVDEQPDQAQRYGVMTLPTTMLLDAAGQVREINYGLTPVHKLQQQIKTVFSVH
ncbi:MAG: thioredoxin family protein [Chloroflexi bacterium]|nr:thioredoxin family protein [Chloroflexota bacterium]